MLAGRHQRRLGTEHDVLGYPGFAAWQGEALVGLSLGALRLYQRHAFRLVELRPGDVDGIRAEKPAIPRTGAHGIPLRDELVLERRL